MRTTGAMPLAKCLHPRSLRSLWILGYLREASYADSTQPFPHGFIVVRAHRTQITFATQPINLVRSGAARLLDSAGYTVQSPSPKESPLPNF
jgi:hypothetical protein